MPVNSFDNYPMSWKPDLSKTTGAEIRGIGETVGGGYQKRKAQSGYKAAAAGGLHIQPFQNHFSGTSNRLHPCPRPIS